MITGDMNPFRQSLKAKRPDDPEIELDQHLALLVTLKQGKLRLRSGILIIKYDLFIFRNV